MIAAGPACGTAATRAAADGAELYNHVTEEDNYKEWKLWPGKGELYAGTEPHGAFLTTYLNSRAFSAVNGKKGSIPDGGIFVKENYSPEKTLESITMMYKIKGFNPDSNDWFWAKYQPDGTIEVEGRVPGCIACHEGREANDYIFTSDIQPTSRY